MKVSVLGQDTFDCIDNVDSDIQSPPSKTLNSTLTQREQEILRWLKEGKSSWDIGKILNISERTVKFHVTNALVKLNAVNRTHAVAIAMEKNLI